MKTYPINHQAGNLRIGIVRARFTNEIGQELEKACLQRLQELGVSSDNITLATVPGALEIPVVLQHMILNGEYDAMIALGVVIRGETYHFELVSNESAAGIARVSLDYATPIANAVLTTENDEQAIARMHIKGKEAAEVAIECANLLYAIEEDA